MNAQFALPLAYHARHGEADFFVSDANREAVHMLGRPSLWPVRACVLTGPQGSGKTHLARIFAAMQRGRATIVEDADAARDEEALFHSWNRAAIGETLLLVTARTPPMLWNIRLPDLASRLAASPTAAIRAPDDALLGAVIAKQFRDRGLDVPAAVIHYALARIHRSFAAAAELVQALDAAALAQGRGVSVPLARTVLRDELGVDVGDEVDA